MLAVTNDPQLSGKHMFCHAQKPPITAGFVTVCCSMSMVSKKLHAAISPVKEATMLHTRLD